MLCKAHEWNLKGNKFGSGKLKVRKLFSKSISIRFFGSCNCFRVGLGRNRIYLFNLIKHKSFSGRLLYLTPMFAIGICMEVHDNHRSEPKNIRSISTGMTKTSDCVMIAIGRILDMGCHVYGACTPPMHGGTQVAGSGWRNSDTLHCRCLSLCL